MPIAIGFLLLLVASCIYAMGNPSVIYFFWGEVLFLLTVAIRVAFANKPWVIKGRALVIVFLGMVGFFMLQSIPDYLNRQILIEVASIVCIILTSTIAIKAVRRKP
jgi:hypothetical protein